MNIDDAIDKFKSFYEILKYFKPTLYNKQIKVIELCIELGVKVEDIDHKNYILASYCANLSYLALSEIINENTFLGDTKKNEIRRHPKLSADMLHELGFYDASQIVLLHHETPIGNGYYGEQINQLEPYLIHISERFIGMTTPKVYPRPIHSKRSAIEELKKEFNKSSFLSDKDKEVIIEVLNKFGDRK
jgi:HD-GYP domain-containing protein (c-di-GMP phosphodiesterase class II)